MCAVEWKKLGDVCKILDSQRKPISKSKRVFGSYPYYGANGIQDYVDGYIFDGTYLLIGEDGSVINKDNSPVLHWVSGQFWVNNHAHILSDIKDAAILKYLYYVLHTIDVSDIVRGVPPKLNQENLKNIVLPIPSLAKQQEIVSHLDTFTTLISNLESELDMRRKQYEHYRNQLLDFDGVEGVEWKTIEDIAEIGTGSSNTKDELDNGLYPFFVRSQQVRWQNKYEYDETAIITSGDGVGVGKIFHYIEGKYALHQRAYRIHILDTSVVAKYVYNYMKCKFYDYIMMNAYSSSVTSVRRPMLLNFEVPIPSSKAQQEIVEKLDAFENLIQSLEQEIKLRKQQYEYYREKLLTFEKE